MVHICFPLHDPKGTYSKYVGVAMYSLLKNTGAAVTIHLLHDDTVTEAIKKNLETVVSEFHQRILFYEIDTRKIEKYSDIVRQFTVGTLFRLYVLELLPSEIDKIIYLDADLLIHMDIEKLWKIDMKGYLVAARMYAESDYWMVCDGLVAKEQYFNAGVLVMNLKRIRASHDLLQETMKFFQKYPNPKFADNDALNFIFRGAVLPLDSCYNCLTIHLRQKGHMLAPCIYHFAGDFINVEEMEAFDKLFFKYLVHTPWGESKAVLDDFLSIMKYESLVMRSFQSVLSRLSQPGCKIILFGAKSKLKDSLLTFLKILPERDYLVDNDKTLQGEVLDGLKVFPPAQLLLEEKGKFFIIVLSKNYYSDIRRQLISYGMEEYKDFHNGMILLQQNQKGYAIYR